jgi:hypothetical protein
VEEKVIRKMFQSMKPVMDERVSWFIYYKGEPIGIWINLPDLNQWFKYLHGKFSFWHKLKFLWIKSTRKPSKFVGLVFGIVPEFQGTGADSYLIIEGARVIQQLYLENGEFKMGTPIYDEYEMQWIGEFNPKMVNVAEVIAGNRSRILTTYRYLFDRMKGIQTAPDPALKLIHKNDPFSGSTAGFLKLQPVWINSLFRPASTDRRPSTLSLGSRI